MEHHWPELWWFLCRDLSFHVVCLAPSYDSLSRILTSTSTTSPEGLAEAFICGGLPPLVDNPDPVYARTYGKQSTLIQLVHGELNPYRKGHRKEQGILRQVPRRRRKSQANHPILERQRGRSAYRNTDPGAIPANGHPVWHAR